MKKLISILIALLWIPILLIGSGCDLDEDEYKVPGGVLGFSVTATVPLDGAVSFPRTGKVIFHLNREPDTATVKEAVTFEILDDQGQGESIAFLARAIGNNIRVTPRNRLFPGRTFRVTMNDSLRSVKGEKLIVPEGGKTVVFTTPQTIPQAQETPSVVGVDPSPEAGFIPDSVTFHLYFSEPIDAALVRYANHVNLIRNGSESVPATVFINANQMVVDPKEDLREGDTYTLTVSGIIDKNGETMTEDWEAQYEVTATFPKTLLPVMMCPTLGEKSPEECAQSTDLAQIPPSILTGGLVNTMTIDSALLGLTEINVSGRLVTEMGDPKINTEFVPLTIRKGQKIYGASLEALLGGRIDTGINTGDIEITLITDANGLLGGSQYLQGVEGGETGLVLTMDAAVNTKDRGAASNAMMAQTILGLTVVGTARVEGGKLIMEVAGFSEMRVQEETIPTEVSFMMTSMDQSDDQIEGDTREPNLRSVTPNKDAIRARLWEQIVVTFDGPLDPETAMDNLFLQTQSGTEVPGKVEVNGSKIIFTPDQLLLPDTNYQIIIGVGIADLAGNVKAKDIVYPFKTGSYESDTDQDNPPILTTTSPGYYVNEAVPAQFPLVVCFNQVIDQSTIKLGDTFSVYDLSEAGRQVIGTIVYQGDLFYFLPNQMWQNGHTYRMEISDRIANIDGLELDLNMDRMPGGGEDFETVTIDFRARTENAWVLKTLKLDPIVDTDGSGYLDGNEVPSAYNTIRMYALIFKDASYVKGNMVTWIKGLDYDDNGRPFLMTDVNDGTYLTATSITANLFGSGYYKGLFDPIGRITIDVTDTGSADIREGNSGMPVMDIALATRLSMENPSLNEMIENDIELESKGELSFSTDGRMVADISGSFFLRGNLDIPLIGELGLPIPTVMKLRAIGDALPYY